MDFIKNNEKTPASKKNANKLGPKEGNYKYNQVGKAEFINTSSQFRVNDLSHYYNTRTEQSLFGEDYYELLKKKFDAYKKGPGHQSSPSKNPIVNLIKENQEEIAELSQPFRDMFDQAVQNVRSSIQFDLDFVD
jgi:hypothetical protein